MLVGVNVAKRPAEVEAHGGKLIPTTGPIAFGYPANLKDEYDIFFDQCLGSGSFGNVYRCGDVYLANCAQAANIQRRACIPAFLRSSKS